MNVTVDLHNASGVSTIPLRRQFKHWATAAMDAITDSEAGAKLSIRVVDEAESASLNSRFRHKEGATNVLSFPAPPEPALGNLLGDLAICAPVVIREAREQEKREDHHWAHLVVHGVLHLQGYDHENERQASEMEELEITILQKLGIANPYLLKEAGNA